MLEYDEYEQAQIDAENANGFSHKMLSRAGKGDRLRFETVPEFGSEETEYASDYISRYAQ